MASYEEFSVYDSTVTKSGFAHDVIIISIDHIDTELEDFFTGMTFHRKHGNLMDLHLKGNGGIIFRSKHFVTAQLGEGLWDLKNELKLPCFFTAFCSNVNQKNTWKFCTSGVESVTFHSRSKWTGLRRVGISSQKTIPLYMNPEPITSMQESSDNVILYTENTEDAQYLIQRVNNYKTTKNQEAIHLSYSRFPRTNKIVFHTKFQNISNVMKQICASNDFFADASGLVCCKSWESVKLLNKFLGTKVVESPPAQKPVISPPFLL
tara:strand:+ start:2060 stop:2851 length:792 start_codon:yes stop_codon:yes gene_type:complete